MKKISQRDYAIKSIGELRKSGGRELFDLNRVVNIPHIQMKAFLLDEVYKPLKDEIERAYAAGFLPIQYAMYFGFYSPQKTTAFGVGHANLGRMISHGIEWGISETIEKHQENPKALELMLYVKAEEGETTFLPNDILSRGLVLV